MKITVLPSIETEQERYQYNIDRYFEKSFEFISQSRLNKNSKPQYNAARCMFNNIIEYERDNPDHITKESPTQLGIAHHYQYYIREIAHKNCNNIRRYEQYLVDFNIKPERAISLKDHPMCDELKNALKRNRAR